MTGQKVIAWIVPLKAHAFDLEDLPIYLEGSPVTVVKRETGHFLWLPIAVAGETHEQVGKLAAEFLGFINGAASVLIHGFRQVELEGGAVYGIDAKGDVASTVIQVGTAEVRCKAGQVMIAISGVAQQDARKGSMNLLLQEATHNRAKADALTLVGRPSPSWSELYLVFELVEANAGSRMYSEGWIDRADAKLFTRTANSYTALGKAGRHGKDRGDPPANPMQQQSAIALMRALVGAWLKDSSATTRNDD